MLLSLLVCCMRVVHGQGVHYGVQSVFEANERLDMKAARSVTSKSQIGKVGKKLKSRFKECMQRLLWPREALGWVGP